tara:strand:+ start:4354 stop:4698 length:345 start_codon:yes stop_codon:yes gene_type:complete
MVAKNADQLYNPHVHGAMHGNLDGGPNSNEPAFGLTSVASGDTSQTVSTALVSSGSLILLTMASDTRQNSGVANAMEVSSIVDGTSFDLAWADGNNTRAAATDVMWMLIRTSQN